jgi:putative DNA methylase
MAAAAPRVQASPHDAGATSQLELGVLPVKALAFFASREGRRQRPIYGAHKWFARRSGAAFRSLLVASTLDANDDFWHAYYDGADLRGMSVLDPFVGGGTSAVEAQRLGATVTGVDVDPVAVAVTSFETKAAGLPDLVEALGELTANVGSLVAPYHATEVAGSARTVVHHFWVQVVECGRCGRELEAHPHHRLAYESVGKRQWVSCPVCHAISELDRKRKRVNCDCSHRFAIDAGTVDFGRLTCLHCRHREPLIEIARRSGRPTWRLFALESIEPDPTRIPVPMSERLFAPATDADTARYRAAAEALAARRGAWTPTDTIPSARYDNRLHDYGYRRYTELFNDRQLLHLSLLAEAIAALPDETRGPIALAFSDHLATNCMLTCFAFGWRRLVPLFSVRGFRHVPRPVEINPWLAGTGRGTFPNAVRQIERAAAFARAPVEPTAAGFRSVPSRAAPAPRIVVGDARKLDIPDASVALVLTDPPYFDNINYSELSDFYRPWLELLGSIGRGSLAREHNLAAVRRDALEKVDFGHRLGDAFAEMARVLQREGRIVLTYRHLTPAAWEAFATAAASSGLVCRQVFPLLAESTNGLHSSAGSVLWDAVFVLAHGKPRARLSRGLVASATRHSQHWAERLASGVPHPFGDADALSFTRAAIVAAYLGFFESRAGAPVTLASVLSAV